MCVCVCVGGGEGGTEGGGGNLLIHAKRTLRGNKIDKLSLLF